MGAYNRTLGDPCCGSKLLLKDILRDKWGFDGHVVSDCWAIKDFHEHLKPTLKKILELNSEKTAHVIYNNVIKPCKKLIQKCSFKSCYDTSRLCALAYWLYIYEYKQLALEICELTHSVDFIFEYWSDDNTNICGLEIRIARELLGENRKNNIPLAYLDHYFSKRVTKSLRYPQILREEEVYNCDSKQLELVLLHALYGLIGKGETGLYNELNEHWEKVEETIIEYIECARTVAGK
jgi:hypothetical protein